MKIEIFTGKLCGIVTVAMAVRSAQHFGFLPVGYFAPSDAKDILLLGGSIVLIVYKKIFSAQK